MGQLIARFLFSWIIHDLVRLASSLFLRENLTKFCVCLRKPLLTMARFHQSSTNKIQQSSFSHLRKTKITFFLMYEFVIINFHWKMRNVRLGNLWTLMYLNSILDTTCTSQAGDLNVFVKLFAIVSIDLVEYHYSSAVKVSGLWPSSNPPIYCIFFLFLTFILLLHYAIYIIKLFSNEKLFHSVVSLLWNWAWIYDDVPHYFTEAEERRSRSSKFQYRNYYLCIFKFGWLDSRVKIEHE